MNMRAWHLDAPAPAEAQPLTLKEREVPSPGEGQVLIKVTACGVCHTDLHIVEGELRAPAYPVIPGHQVVGRVEKVGSGVKNLTPGQRVGAIWLYKTCGVCEYCRAGRENLCARAQFTGYHQPGGFAEYMMAYADYVFPLPDSLDDVHAAPLLCGGVIGYRTLRVAQVQPGEVVALFGFGASAHLVIQVLRHWDCQVLVYTRSPQRQQHARALGAFWAGHPNERGPLQAHRALIFAPAGHIVPLALERIRPGGTVAINAIYMTPIPQTPYNLLFGEKSLLSVSHVTRQDAREFLQLADDIPLKTTVQVYAWPDANQALIDKKHGRIVGEAVLDVAAT